MNNSSIGVGINRTGWVVRCRLESRKGNGRGEISGLGIGWTRGLSVEKHKTQEKNWFGWGWEEKMTPNSVSVKLSFRWFLDTQWELTIGSEFELSRATQNGQMDGKPSLSRYCLG